MTTIAILAGFVLVVLVATASLGAVALAGWLRHRNAHVPTRKIATHMTLQTLGVALWVVFLLTSQPRFAWISFGVITAGQVFGDLLMFASYRARHGTHERGSYVAVAKDVLGFSRPVAALHAILGALGWFTMLALCIAATVR